jgi:hypothetical protein
MKGKAMFRHVTLGALATGLIPLTASGAGAGPAGDGAALCRSTFGDRGPAGGPVVGEGPSGDPMVVSIGWNPGDWSDGRLGRIVTCVSADGHAVPTLATATVSPPNTGSLTLKLTLPAGEPGTLVCERSVLVGTGDAAGDDRATSPVCFKLRAAGPPARTPKPPTALPAPRPAPPDPISTPPARAAFEAAVRSTGREAAAPAVGPETGPLPTPPVKAPASTRAHAAATGAPATPLPRTGFDHNPLADAGGLLALGGAAIVFGEPRRRSRSARSV